MDHSYTVPGNVGVVLLTRLAAAQLTSLIIDQCKVRRIPHYGIYRSTGGVQRTLDLALSMAPMVNATDAGDAEETEADQKLREVDRQVLASANGAGYTTHPPAHATVVPKPTPPPFASPAPLTPLVRVPTDTTKPASTAAMPTIAEIQRLFADVRLNLDLVESEVIRVLTEQGTALAAVDKLRRLQELLK